MLNIFDKIKLKLGYTVFKQYSYDIIMIVFPDGTKEFSLKKSENCSMSHFILHREDGPAVEIYNGNKGWYINDKLHREDGPAVEYANGYKAWYLNDKRHREDGPAVEYTNGYKAWYLNGINIYVKDNDEFLRIVKLKAFL